MDQTTSDQTPTNGATSLATANEQEESTVGRLAREYITACDEFKRWANLLTRRQATWKKTKADIDELSDIRRRYNQAYTARMDAYERLREVCLEQ